MLPGYTVGCPGTFKADVPAGSSVGTEEDDRERGSNDVEEEGRKAAGIEADSNSELSVLEEAEKEDTPTAPVEEDRVDDATAAVAAAVSASAPAAGNIGAADDKEEETRDAEAVAEDDTAAVVGVSSAGIPISPAASACPGLLVR